VILPLYLNIPLFFLPIKSLVFWGKCRDALFHPFRRLVPVAGITTSNEPHDRQRTSTTLPYSSPKVRSPSPLPTLSHFIIVPLFNSSHSVLLFNSSFHHTYLSPSSKQHRHRRRTFRLPLSNQFSVSCTRPDCGAALLTRSSHLATTTPQSKYPPSQKSMTRRGKGMQNIHQQKTDTL
jgi:hypothetical protein